MSEVKYTLKYSAKKDIKSVEEALSGGGKAAAKNEYTASHLAGTESGGQQVLHAVTGGSIELIATGTDKTKTKISQTFTVDSKGTLKVISESKESEGKTGSVLGANTETGPQINPPTTNTLYTNLPSSTPARTKTEQTTAPPAPLAQKTDNATTIGANSSWLTLIGFMATIIGLVFAFAIWQKLRKNRSTSYPPVGTPELPSEQ